MNERIRELVGQVKWQCQDVTYDELEKFAELIVRECAQVVENKTSAPGYGVAESWCEYKDLFEHFGIER